MKLCCCTGLFSSCGELGLLSYLRCQASPCGGFSCGAEALKYTGFSSCGTGVQYLGPRALDQRLYSCGAWAYLHCGM